jgi:hypothetical protein
MWAIRKVTSGELLKHKQREKVLLYCIQGVYCAGLSDFSLRGIARRHFSRQMAQLFRGEFRR